MPGEYFQRKINKQGQDHIDALKAVVHQLWVKMCEEDGIPPDSKFVVFSDDNKYAPFYHNAMDQLWEAQSQYAAGGYVGLRIANGRTIK